MNICVLISLQLFAYIIGREGCNKKRVEQETGATVTVPGRYARDARAVVVKGKVKENVAMARHQTEMLISSATSNFKLDYSHFISIPLVCAGNVTRLETFRQSVSWASMYKPAQFSEIYVDIWGNALMLRLEIRLNVAA